MVKHRRKMPCNNKSKLLLILTISVTIILMVVLLSLAIHLRSQRESSWTPRQQKICYPQYKMVTGDSRNVSCHSGLASNVVKNISQCCGHMSDVINFVVKKLLVDSERYDSDINPEMVFFDLTDFNCVPKKEQQPILKLTLAHEQMLGPSGLYNKVCWRRNISSFTNSVMKYLEDDCSVLVEESGLFYISSQLNLKVNNMSSEFGANVGHHVNLLSDNNTAAVLLQNVNTRCEIASNGPQDKTSEIGAPFRMKKGDRIFVTTSHPECLVPDDEINYFSLYKL